MKIANLICIHKTIKKSHPHNEGEITINKKSTLCTYVHIQTYCTTILASRPLFGLSQYPDIVGIGHKTGYWLLGMPIKGPRFNSGSCVILSVHPHLCQIEM